MAQMYSPGGRTTGDFGQHTRWPGRQRARNVMTQTGGALFESQLPTHAVDYPQQLFANEYMNNPYATGPGTNSFGGYSQQASPDVQMDNPYSRVPGANHGIHRGGQDGFGFGSDSNPFAAQSQQHIFPDEQVDDQHQYAIPSYAEHDVQMDSSFATNSNANPLAVRTTQIPSYDIQGGGYQNYATAAGGGPGTQVGAAFAMGPRATRFTQFGNQAPDAETDGQHASSSSESSHFAQHLIPYVQTNDQDAIDSGSNSFSVHKNTYSDGYTNNQSSTSSEAPIKREHSDDDYDPGDIAIEDDVEEETSQQPGKKRKINKNGRMRKTREPRGHLRRWDEDDVSRALMGIVWACGENGVVIPFAQAAKIVDQDCTSGALQQAILKMHDKMNKDGAQLPKIKMNWPKKPSAGGNSIIRDNGKVPRKKPTLTQATQCNIVSFSARQRNTLSAAGEATQEDRVLPINGSCSGQSGSADIKYVRADEMPSSPRKLLDLPPSTPAQHRGSPVCPPAPLHPKAPRPAMVDSSTVTTPNQRFLSNNASSSSPNFAQQCTTGFTPQQDLSSSANLRNLRFQRGRSNTTQLGPLAAFNADFEQRINSAGLAQQSTSSSMRLDTAMSRNATSSNDFTKLHSPMSGGFETGGSSQDFVHFPSTESSFYVGEFFRPSDPYSAIDGPSPGLRPAFTPGRRDSVFGSATQLASSSQGSTGPMNRSAREAQNAFQDRLEAATAEGPTTPMPSRAMRAYHSLQHPRQQLCLGLHTLENPFGGTFGDARGGLLSPTHPLRRGMDDPFEIPSITDEVMDFENV
ncbi:hypothetical protein PMIN07_009421 [Paraphaeosphaeria minitans]